MVSDRLQRYAVSH